MTARWAAMGFCTLAIASALLAIACSGGGGGSCQPHLPTSGSETDRIQASARLVLGAMVEHDAGALCTYSSRELRDLADESEFEQLAACIPPGVTVQPIDGDVAADGTLARITFTLEAVENGQPREVPWVLELTRQEEEETWAMSTLPECPI